MKKILFCVCSLAFCVQKLTRDEVFRAYRHPMSASTVFIIVFYIHHVSLSLYPSRKWLTNGEQQV